MQLFFDPLITIAQQEIVFSNEESRHISRVLRKKTNDPIIVTNGKGLAWHGRLKIVDQRHTVAVQTESTQHQVKAQKIHLAIAPTKSNDRMEWLLEKATEIGVHTITPIQCHHSERKTIKAERFNKILISALKQSQQLFIPQLNPLVTMNEFVANTTAPFYIAHCEKGDKTALSALNFNTTQTTILIGPEGDFSSDEIAYAIKNGGIPVSLGENRLRTETAGIVAVHTVVLKQSLDLKKTN